MNINFTAEDGTEGYIYFNIVPAEPSVGLNIQYEDIEFRGFDDSIYDVDTYIEEIEVALDNWYDANKHRM